MKYTTLSLICAALITSMSGCGTTPQLTPQQKKQVQQFNEKTQLQELAQELHKAMNEDQLPFYAPVSLEEAQDALHDAQEAKLKNEQLLYYLQAKKALKHGYDTKKLVQQYLADLADIKQRMDKQRTKEIYPDRYEDFLDDYDDLIKMIDKEELQDVLEDKKEVLKNAQDLYGDAVVFRNINKAALILDSMDDEDLNELAPKLYEKAQRVYEQTRLKIKSDPDNTQLIETIAQHANETALYAQTIANDVRRFRELPKDEQENFFASIHKNLATLNPKEKSTAILPLPMDEKFDYLRKLK